MHCIRVWHSWTFWHQGISEYICIKIFPRANVPIYLYKEYDTNECPSKYLYLKFYEYSSSFYTLTHSRENVRIYSKRKLDTNKCPKRYLWLRILFLNIDWTEKGPLSNYLLRKNFDQYCCSSVWKAPLMVSNCNQMQNILKRSSLQMHLHFGHSITKIGPQSLQSASEAMCAHPDIHQYIQCVINYKYNANTNINTNTMCARVAHTDINIYNSSIHPQSVIDKNIM